MKKNLLYDMRIFYKNIFVRYEFNPTLDSVQSESEFSIISPFSRTQSNQ